MDYYNEIIKFFKAESEQDQLIKDAIVKEMLRDGQVFILYNRVETIESKMVEIQKLVPNAVVEFAHAT